MQLSRLKAKKVFLFFRKDLHDDEIKFETDTMLQFPNTNHLLLTAEYQSDIIEYELSLLI